MDCNFLVRSLFKDDFVCQKLSYPSYLNYLALSSTIISRILITVLFSIYRLLLLHLLNCVMSVLLLNSYWIGLDWIGPVCVTMLQYTPHR